jgi:hypothetical protein
MLVEQFLRLLITAVRTSKVGVLFLALAVLIVFALVVLGIASLVGDLLFMASARVPMIHFLGTGWGILAAAACAVVFALLGIGILWFLKSHVAQTEAPQAENLSPPSPPSESDEVEELRTNLRQVEQERDGARQEIERLRIELNNRPPRHFNTPVGVIETLTPAKAKEMEELKAENERLRNQVGSPEVAKQKKLCLYLADDLRALYESFEQDERVLLAQLEKRKSAGATTEELEEERRAKQAEIEKRVLRKYHRGYSDRLETLYDAPEPDSWLGPNDESLFLNVNAPHEIVMVADRLAEVGHRL